MATREVVEIVIREKGAKATSNAIKGVGRSSRGTAKAIGALVVALGVLAGAKGLAGVATNAINASAAFEQYGIRLGALLGSQEEANKALDGFVELASKTPFAVSQIVEGASTLGAAALGNREKLEELTQTAANLAAVTGLSFQEAAGNLQRSLQAGIGAADLFRERGVRALIESIAGIPDATKATKEELDAAFADVFGAGGVFGAAAENLATTLGGALSNIGDAATNLNVALGDAFAPAVINTARGVIIPFLTQLQGLVAANEEELGRFAAGAVRDTLEGLLSLAQGGLAVAQAFDQITRGIGTGFNAVIGTILEVVLAFQEANAAFLEFTGASDLEVAGVKANVAGLRAQIDALAQAEGDAGRENEEFARTLDAINDQIVGLQASLRSTDLSIDPRVQAADVDLGGAGAGGAPAANATAIKEQEAAAARLVRLTEQLRVSDANRLDPLQGQLERLQQQEAAIRAAADAAGDLASAEEALELNAAAVAATEAEISAELARQATLQAEITALIGQAALLSPVLAEEIRAAAQAAVAAGGGLEAVNDELEKIGETAADGIEDAKVEAGGFSDSLSGALETSVGTAISGAFSGEGVDAAQLFADLSGTLVKDALDQAFSGLGDLAGGLGGGGILGGFDVGGLVTAGVTAASSVLAGALRETSSQVSNDLVRSAASQSSAAATRGVIAGPTNVPIFQIGATLEAAFGPTNGILEEIAGLLGILVQSGTGTGGPVAASDFDSTTPSLS